MYGEKHVCRGTNILTLNTCCINRWRLCFEYEKIHFTVYSGRPEQNEDNIWNTRFNLTSQVQKTLFDYKDFVFWLQLNLILSKNSSDNWSALVQVMVPCWNNEDPVLWRKNAWSSLNLYTSLYGPSVRSRFWDFFRMLWYIHLKNCIYIQ